MILYNNIIRVFFFSGDPYELDTTRPVKTSQSAGGISTAISDSEDIKNAAEIISDEDGSGSESESEDDYADQAIVINQKFSKNRVRRTVCPLVGLVLVRSKDFIQIERNVVGRGQDRVNRVSGDLVRP